MTTTTLTRRAALLSFGGFAAAGLSGCNTTQTAAVRPQLAPGFRIAAINVDAAPLLAQSGDPTAAWVQQALPGALAQAFASHMALGDLNAATLNVTINSVILGPVGPGGQATDWMKGVATLGARHTRLNATSYYIPSPVAQALPEQAFQGRVTALSQSFAYWLARRWRR